jgi:hypothetical protein
MAPQGLAKCPGIGLTIDIIESESTPIRGLDEFDRQAKRKIAPDAG